MWKRITAWLLAGTMALPMLGAAQQPPKKPAQPPKA
jgi:hypothetical protein